MQPLRPQGHLAPPRLTTMWPISPAAPRPSQGLPSRTMPPPTPVPQKTPIRLWNSRPAPRWNSASVATWTSLPILTSVPERLGERLAEREAALPAGQVAGAGDDAGLRRRRRPGEPTPTPARPPARHRPPRPPRAGRPPSLGRRRPGPARSGSGGALRRGPCRAASTITVWILVPPRSMPPARLADRCHSSAPTRRSRALRARRSAPG